MGAQCDIALFLPVAASEHGHNQNRHVSMVTEVICQASLLCAVLPVRVRMRRKAVRSIVIHTKDSIQHLKDDDDEMLRGMPYEQSLRRWHEHKHQASTSYCIFSMTALVSCASQHAWLCCFGGCHLYFTYICSQSSQIRFARAVCSVACCGSVYAHFSPFADSRELALLLLTDTVKPDQPTLILTYTGVDWKIVSRFCDVSRSYKTFQNPNDESEAGPKTWRGWFLHILTLPGILPKSMAKLPGQLWRTISGREKDMQLGKHAHKGHGKGLFLVNGMPSLPSLIWHKTHSVCCRLCWCL